MHGHLPLGRDPPYSSAISSPRRLERRADVLPAKSPAAASSGRQLARRLSVEARRPCTWLRIKLLDGLLALRQQAPAHRPTAPAADAPAAAAPAAPGRGRSPWRRSAGQWRRRRPTSSTAPRLLQPVGCILRQLRRARRPFTGQPCSDHLLFRQHSAAGESGATGFHL